MGILHKVEFLKRNDELKGECNMHRVHDLVVCLGGLNLHVGGHDDGLDGVHGGHGMHHRKLEERMLLLLFGEKRQKHRQFIQNVKAIPGEYQHAFEVADIDKKKTQNCSEKDMY